MDIIPSHLQVGTTRQFSDGNLFNDVSLRMGEVQRVLFPDDSDNVSKKFVEYDVYCQYRAKNKAAGGRMYKNCLLASHFGGAADKVFFNLRKSDSASQEGTYKAGLGAKVLILCVNGETQNPVIISGLRDVEDKTDKSLYKDLGNFFQFEFNGIHALINKDGELVITYGGKTNDDGTTSDDVDSGARSTVVGMEKDGSFIIKSKDSEQFIRLDNTDKNIQLKHKEGVKIGEGSDKMLLASTYRSAEDTMLSDLSSGLNGLMQKMTLIGVQMNLLAVALAGVPFPKPLAQTPAQQAAQKFTDAVQDIQKMTQAIDKFKNDADKYLSKKNLND